MALAAALLSGKGIAAPGLHSVLVFHPTCQICPLSSLFELFVTFLKKNKPNFI